MPAEIGFRPVVPADGPMLALWIARPHSARWWGQAEEAAAGPAHGTHMEGPCVLMVRDVAPGVPPVPA